MTLTIQAFSGNWVLMIIDWHARCCHRTFIAGLVEWTELVSLHTIAAPDVIHTCADAFLWHDIDPIARLQCYSILSCGKGMYIHGNILLLVFGSAATCLLQHNVVPAALLTFLGGCTAYKLSYSNAHTCRLFLASSVVFCFAKARISLRASQFRHMPGGVAFSGMACFAVAWDMLSGIPR